MESDFKSRMSSRIKSFIIELIKFIDALQRDTTCIIIAKQLLRSGMSIGANFAEARAASSRKDYILFFTYSLKSANETKYWIDILSDSGKCDSQKGKRLLNDVTEIANIFGSSIVSLKRKTKSP
jgi:four helix bundle protein